MKKILLATAAAVIAAAGAFAYKTLSHNPQILISRTNEETFIYRPKKNELVFVKIGNQVYNEVMPSAEIDEIVYASMGNDAMGRASFIYNAKTNELLANFDKQGEDIGTKEAKCKTSIMN